MSSAATRLKRAPRRHNTRDARGTIRVQAVLLDPKSRAHKRGNITRAFHLSAATVGEVARELERLFHPRPSAPDALDGGGKGN